MAKRCVALFRWSVIALGVSTISIFFIPLLQDHVAVQYTLAAIFWLSLITELIFLMLANGVRRKIDKISPHMKQKRGFRRLGLFCFFQNPKAMIADITFCISSVLLIVVIFLRADSVWLFVVSLVLTYLCFHLHCILNGILYRSVEHYCIVIQKRRERK